MAHKRPRKKGVADTGPVCMASMEEMMMRVTANALEAALQKSMAESDKKWEERLENFATNLDKRVEARMNAQDLKIENMK
eukprot:10121036-Lingulodinium_polyedra.AAC.1